MTNLFGIGWDHQTMHEPQKEPTRTGARFAENLI